MSRKASQKSRSVVRTPHTFHLPSSPARFSKGSPFFFNWRAKMLYLTIDVMFQGDPLVSARKIYRNPLVRALGRNAAKVARLSAVERFGWHEPHTKNSAVLHPARCFLCRGVFETLMTSGTPLSEAVLSPEGFIKTLRQRAAACSGAHPLMSILRITLATQGTSIQAVKLAIEKWFSDSMDRASGWYKRRTQVWLLWLGLAIAVGGHVDTIAIAQWLWSGDAARQAAMAAAQSYAGKNNPAPAAMPTDPQLKTYFADVASQIGDLDHQISDLQYPIGWYDAQEIRKFSLQFAIGALITAIAISRSGKHVLVRRTADFDQATGRRP